MSNNHVLFDGTRKGTFALFKSKKPTSTHLRDQEHTKVNNLLEVQKMPYLDPEGLQFEMKRLPDHLLIAAMNTVRNSPTPQPAVASPVKAWRHRITTEQSPRQNGNQVFRGSLNPKEWRTSKDTEEIDAVMKPFEYPHGKIQFFPAKQRFKTLYNSEFKQHQTGKK